jgi:MscS family membrane protein
MRVEDFAARDRIRFATTVGLLHGTSEQQVRQVVGEIERLLRGLPLAWPDVVVSRLAAFSPSSLDVEVLCWFVTSDFEEYRRLREEALLGILRIVEGAGTAIAPPTVQLAARRRPSAAAGRPPQARE